MAGPDNQHCVVRMASDRRVSLLSGRVLASDAHGAGGQVRTTVNMFGQVSIFRLGPELLGPSPRRINCASGHVLRSASTIAMVLQAAAGYLSAAHLNAAQGRQA